MDFHCPVHGFFEAREAFDKPVSQSWACPICGAPSPRVWLRAPALGKIAKGTFVVDFPGGHTLTRDDVEERLASKPGVPFANDPTFAERIYDRAMVRAYKREQGEIPPRPEPTESEVKLLERELAKQGT